ncbi:hypothetical protein MFIFM68171_02574 [Madurella fahalii]|uniref:Uncharacterized protein n=1 Tax=Madurella fahalii TaxID=1157608 RepID=A0ABQ0G3N1_9PEZI
MSKTDQPPAVIKIRSGRLIARDVDGSDPRRPTIRPKRLEANRRLVIYELPTSWLKAGSNARGVDIDVGTFADVQALLKPASLEAAPLPVPVIRGKAILAELGINALELLLAADARIKGGWATQPPTISLLISITGLHQPYDPESDKTKMVHPSCAFHKSHLARWMTDFAVGGLRIDGVNNIANWDFVRAYRDRAWELYNDRCPNSTADPSKFPVVGEELGIPIDIVRGGHRDVLWNEPWQQRLRVVLVGEGARGDNFEWTLRKVANCLLDRFDGGRGFEHEPQAVNYVTLHDIEAYGNEKKRSYNFCKNKGILDIEKRAKLTFVMLLTSVGIPMIL